MDISVLITSKNEPYLAQTIEDIKANAKGTIEILAEEDDGRGQRAMLNKLAGQAKGKYLLKVDAHCSFGLGFDTIMLEDMDEATIMAPYLMPLDVEKWVVSHHNKMSSYVFDTNLVMHFAPNTDDLINDTMCLQGSCFLVSRETFFKWDLCDETLGSWGHQGVELGIKAWNNGGRCVTTKKTYYGHLFRHTELDFPYKRSQEAIDETHNKFIKKFKTKDIGWLIERFGYPVDWTPEAVAKL